MDEPSPDGSVQAAAQALKLVRATPADLAPLNALVAAYHAFERIDMSAERRRLALSQLLDDPALGNVWLIYSQDTLVGYIAVCFGYSIEFAGRDAFLDEFFLDESVRGRGVGSLVIERVVKQLAEAGIVALHLEVDKHNDAAQRFYARHRFVERDKYHLLSLNLCDQSLSAD